MYNKTNITNAYGNTGIQDLQGDYGKLKYLLLCPVDAEMATQAAALLKSNWIANLNAAVGSRWYLCPLVWNNEPTQEDNVKETSDFGFEDVVRKGKLTYKITFPTMHMHNKNRINYLDGKDFAAYEITDEDYIKGFSIDGVKLLPKRLDYFSILPETQKTGSANAHVMAELRFSDTAESNKYEVALNPYNDAEVITPWRPSIELSSIKDLAITVSAMDATTATITLKGYDGTPYSAAVAADVYMRKTSVDGVAITVSNLVETSTSGTYTATFASQTSGTFYFSLYDQPTATTKGVETPVNATYAATIS